MKDLKNKVADAIVCDATSGMAMWDELNGPAIQVLDETSDGGYAMLMIPGDETRSAMFIEIFRSDNGPDARG